jgi:hypothetical protein
MKAPARADGGGDDLDHTHPFLTTRPLQNSRLSVTSPGSIGSMAYPSGFAA